MLIRRYSVLPTQAVKMGLALNFAGKFVFKNPIEIFVNNQTKAVVGNTDFRLRDDAHTTFNNQHLCKYLYHTTMYIPESLTLRPLTN